MIATLVSALAVVLSATLVGQLICALCGAHRWTAAAPAVGLSAELLVAMAGPHLPGRMTLPFLSTVLLTVAGAALVSRRTEHLPPAGSVLAAGLTSSVTLIPFFAQRRFGVLGVGFNNDMASHLLYAGSYRDAELASSAPLLDYYPFGPHALVAEFGHGLNLGLDGVFTGMTIVMPVLAAITVFSLLRRVGWPSAVLASVAAAMPYLVAAYVGEGAFKEVMFPMLLLGTVGLLGSLRRGEVTGIARLVPLGLLVGGVLSMYSIPGLAWIGGTAALALVGVAIAPARAGGAGALVAEGRALVVPAALAGAALVLAIVPQLPRLHAFWRYMHQPGASGTGIGKDDMGNLAGPLKFLESTGIWLSADFRYPPLDQTPSSILGLLVLAAAAWGAVRLLRRGQPELVAATITCLVLAAWSSHSQSPYTTAKSFVIVSPFLVALAALALLERRPDAKALRVGRLTVAVGLACVAAVSSFLTLRYLPVGPRTHEQQLAKFRSLLQGKKVLLTLNDEYGSWYLSGATTAQPLFPAPRRDVGGVPVLPVKEEGLGHAYDWDSFGNLDRFDAVVMARDPSSSQAPSNFKLRATSGPWQLFVRTGPSKLRGVLSGEHADAGQGLDCAAPEGKAVLKGGGMAGIRDQSVRVMSPAVLEGTTVPVAVGLKPGRWWVNVAYNWRAPVRLRGAGLDTQLPASLDRQGTRYLAGQITVTGSGPLTVRLTANATRLHRPGMAMGPAELSFTRVRTERTVPVREACGKYLDWYEPRAG